MNERVRKFYWIDLAGVVLAALLATGLLAYASPRPATQTPVFGAVVDSAAFTVGGATMDLPATPSTGATSLQAYVAFDTVSGSFTTCTFQAKTSFDGTNFVTLGTAASVAITSSTKTYWAVLAQAPTSTVTTTTPSTTAALGFGTLTKFTVACSGGYGTSAPGTLTTILQ